jgi:hypothetical protein
MARTGALLLLTFLLQSCGEARTNAVDTTQPETNREATSSPVANNAIAAPDPGIDLGGFIAFANFSQCEATPSFGRVINGLLRFDQETGTASVGPAVAVPGADTPIRPRLRTQHSTDEGLQMTEYEAALAMPANATWHGLRVSRLVGTYLNVSESDDQTSTAIEFRETPARVQQVLAAHGMRVPLAPHYLELHDEACGGAMQIAQRSGGAALQCGYGC